MATPTMNRKNGKIRSVGVQPCHAAWRSGGWIALQVPGLFTSSIPAIVMPRKMSSETSRPLPVTFGAAGAGAATSPRGAVTVLMLAAPPRSQ